MFISSGFIFSWEIKAGMILKMHRIQYRSLGPTQRGVKSIPN